MTNFLPFAKFFFLSFHRVTLMRALYTFPVYLERKSERMNFVPDSEKVMDTESDTFSLLPLFHFSLQLCNFFLLLYRKNFLPVSVCCANFVNVFVLLFFSIFNDFYFPFRQKASFFEHRLFFRLRIFLFLLMNKIKHEKRKGEFSSWCWMKCRMNGGGRERWRPIWCSYTNWLQSNNFSFH